MTTTSALFNGRHWILPLLLLVGILIAGGHATLSMRPSNTMDVAGSKVTLLCRSTAAQSKIDWIFTPSGDENDTLITSTIVAGCKSLSDNYTIESTQTGECNLVISNLTLYHAGRYACNDSSEYLSARLGVMSSIPTYAPDRTRPINEGDRVWMNYTLDYYGAFGIKVSLRSADIPQGSSNSSMSYKEYPRLYEPFEIRFSDLFTARTLKVPSYYCSTVFTLDQRALKNTEARNDPTYRHDIQTDPLPIPYRPGMFYMSIIGANESFSYRPLGDTVTCYAATKPQPSYQWIDPNGNVTAGSNVTLSILGNKLNYTCKAWNDQGNGTIDYIVTVYNAGCVQIPHLTAVLIGVALSWLAYTFISRPTN